MEEDKIAVLEAPEVEVKKEVEVKTETPKAEPKKEEPKKFVELDEPVKEEQVSEINLDRKSSSSNSVDDAFIEEIVISGETGESEEEQQEEVVEEKQEEVVVRPRKPEDFLTLEELSSKYETTQKNEELFEDALNGTLFPVAPTSYQEIQNEVIETSEPEQEEELEKEESVPQRTSTEKPSSIFIEKPKNKLKSFKNKKYSTGYNPENAYKKSRLKKVILGAVLCFCAIFCVTNTIIIENTRNVIVTEQEQYDINLVKYFEKIATLDETNKALDVFETYPEEIQLPSSTAEKSNWFNRLCNWFSGIFGG